MLPRIRLFERRTLWCPTWFGAFCVIFVLVAPTAWWFIYGESFLSLTDRLPAEVLVVEGWIGTNGMRAAAREFRTGGYRYVAATGSRPADEKGWQETDWSYAQGAANELARCGTPSYYQSLPWWRSSDRIKELLTETAGCLFEALLNSGRGLSGISENYP
jgi:hypothetical protein